VDHAAFPELIAGRSLGGLDPAEARSLDGHLAVCAGCRALQADLAGVVADLALLAPPRPAPSLLGMRVLGAIHAEAAAPARVRHLPAMPTLRTGGAGRSVPGWFTAGVGAAAAIVIAALGFQLAAVRTTLDGQAARLSAAEEALAARDTAMAVVADPAHASAWLAPSTDQAGHGVVVLYVPGRAEAWLVADDLPPTPGDRVYQFWHADATGVHAGMTFRWDGHGVLALPVPVDLSGAQAAMLTLEPPGGATETPGEDIVFGELAAS